MAAAPGRVLRLSLVAWGLGELANGRRYVASTWLLAEAICLAVVAIATWLFAGTTWYLLPFLLGMAFVVAWAAQAVAAYRHAQRTAGQATPPTARRSPAAAVAWLTLPLLAWGTGFWLITADGTSPAAVSNRVLSGWSDAAADGRPTTWGTDLSQDPAALSSALAAATGRLQALCADGTLASDCADDSSSLLRDVRVRIDANGNQATATAELVRFERRETTFLGLFGASDLEPVALREILRLDLAAQPAALGAQRWTVVSATVP